MNPLYALAVATFAVGTQTYVFAGLLGDMARDLGLSIGVAGQLSTVFAITFALAAPLAAGFAARFEPRTILTLALVATGAINLMAALAANFPTLMALRIVAALAAAFVTPIATATAAMLAPPERRGKALALVMAGLTIAFALGIPLGSVVGGQFGWRSTFTFAGVVALAAAFVTRTWLPLIPAQPRSTRPLSATLGEWRVLSNFALTFLSIAATFTVVAYLGPVVNRVTGLTGGAVGPFQACVGIGSIIGVIIGGRIADRAGIAGIVVSLFAVIAVTLATYTALLMGFASSAAAFLLGGIILVGATALFSLMPLVQARLARAAPQAGPIVFGINGSMNFAGQGAGALLGGIVTETIGFSAIGIAGAAVAIIAIFLTLAGKRRDSASEEKGCRP